MNTLAVSQKIDLIHWITELEDVVILSQLNAIKEKNATESDVAELRLIKRGLDDLQNGKTVSHAQAQKRYEKWL